MRRVSILMAYYNRKELIIPTLRSIARTETPYKDIEVVIVDDGSNPEHALTEKDFRQFSFPVVLVSVDKKDKNWVNSCTAYNLAIKNSSGDILLIQNPECLHVGDAISFTLNRLKDSDYFSFHCWNANDIGTKEILELPGFEPKAITEIIQKGNGCWYNHHDHRPCGYHFLSAVKRHHVLEMRGFDERYAPGVAFEDDEFLFRIKLKGLKLKFIGMPMCVHLYHLKFSEMYPDSKQYIERNRSLFNNVTVKERKWLANENSSDWV
jgi:glycosyltransferase involved in cell wall biosynthesis